MLKTPKTSKKDVNAPKKKRDFHRKDARKEANSIKKRYPGSILSQDISFFTQKVSVRAYGHPDSA